MVVQSYDFKYQFFNTFVHFDDSEKRHTDVRCVIDRSPVSQLTVYNFLFCDFLVVLTISFTTNSAEVIFMKSKHVE